VAHGASDPRFVADVMLGKLARWLRALGLDTLYDRDAPDARLLGIALRERRHLLTRDAGLAARAGPVALLVRAASLEEQLREVTARYGVSVRAPLSRCLECNGELSRRSPGEIRERVPPYTFATQREFWECGGCRRVYWAGTHASRILARLAVCVGSAPPSVALGPDPERPADPRGDVATGARPRGG
jgi:uncharacterized protein with PIN domain